MNDLVLAIIGSVGIASLVMSMKDDANKKEVREDFNGFALRNSKLEKVVKDKHGNEHGFAVDQYPNIKCAATPAKPIKENYANGNGGHIVGNGLGSKDVTKMPYFTPTPHLNQTVNKPSPSLNLPSIIRYNPPSLSKMGVTEDYQCQKQAPAALRENYVEATCNKPSTPYMSPVEDYVGPNYSATPRPTPVMNPFINSPVDGISQDGFLQDPFNGKEVMVFDRPMTTTLKVGRFAARGCRDLIRGDLPCAPNTHQGWFSTPADPTALSKGALQAIAGSNESSNVLNKFMEIYGDASGVGAGVNLADPVNYQYTAYEMTNNNQGVCDNTVSVSSF